MSARTRASESMKGAARTLFIRPIRPESPVRCLPVPHQRPGSEGRVWQAHIARTKSYFAISLHSTIFLCRDASDMLCLCTGVIASRRDGQLAHAMFIIIPPPRDAGREVLFASSRPIHSPYIPTSPRTRGTLAADRSTRTGFVAGPSSLGPAPPATHTLASNSCQWPFQSTDLEYHHTMQHVDVHKHIGRGISTSSFDVEPWTILVTSPS